MAEIKLESQMGKLYELRNSLKQGNETYEGLKKKYEALIEIVKNSDRAEEVGEEFIPGIEANLKEVDDALNNHALRIAYVNALIDKYENDEEARATVDSIVTMTFMALGIDVSAPQTDEAPEEKSEE